MSWSDESFADLGYTYPYECNLNLINLECCLLFSGKKFLPIKKDHRYLEIGFGGGLSLNIHAATHGIECWGVEPNAELAAFANDLAKASGANLKIFNEPLDSFFSRKELPEFDVIVMHDIWSYLSLENQQRVVDFVSKKLAVGGLFYVSYNTPLGERVRTVPLRDLMKLNFDRSSKKLENTQTKISSSIDFISRTITSDYRLINSNPQLNQDISAIASGELASVAKNYFTTYSHLVCFSQMSEMLADSKLTFAGHGKMLDNIDLLCLPEPNRQFLSSVTDPVLKEVTRDFLFNHEQRHDVWVKGYKALTTIEKTQAIADVRYVLPTPPEDINFRINIPAGETMLPDDVYTPILHCLAENDHAPKTGEDLVNYYQLSKLMRPQILDALLVLMALHYIYPVQSDEVIERAKPVTSALNQYLLEQAVHSDKIQYLASPVTGGGISMSRIQQLFLLARSEEAASPKEWASLTWQLISQQTSVINIENHPVKTAEEGIRLLETLAQDFAQKKIPILQVLGVVD